MPLDNTERNVVVELIETATIIESSLRGSKKAKEDLDVVSGAFSMLVNQLSALLDSTFSKADYSLSLGVVLDSFKSAVPQLSSTDRDTKALKDKEEAKVPAKVQTKFFHHSGANVAHVKVRGDKSSDLTSTIISQNHDLNCWPHIAKAAVDGNTVVIEDASVEPSAVMRDPVDTLPKLIIADVNNIPNQTVAKLNESRKAVSLQEVSADPTTKSRPPAGSHRAIDTKASLPRSKKEARFTSDKPLVEVEPDAVGSNTSSDKQLLGDLYENMYNLRNKAFEGIQIRTVSPRQSDLRKPQVFFTPEADAESCVGSMVELSEISAAAFVEQDLVIAIYDFQARSGKEISLVKGDILLVRKRQGTWVYCAKVG
jgi:SH3 domain